MPVNELLVKYDSYKNSIIFPKRIAAGILPAFAGAIKTWHNRGHISPLTLDFTKVEKAFANGMLGIIATTNELRRQNIKIILRLPSHEFSKEYFETTRWTYLLDPSFKDNYTHNGNHFVKCFTDYTHIPDVVNQFMEIIMGHIQMPRDVLAALEWSITEICDNVVNHANSKIGGYIQVIAYPKHDLVAFTVADAGKGILHSLQEGFPNLQSDLDAIEEAIKEGSTRNKNDGQGNGLTGTTRITNMTGGSLHILTGSASLLLETAGQKSTQRSSHQYFNGTCISGQIKMSHDFEIVNALSFGTSKYTPYTIIDAKYEKQDEDALLFNMNEQLNGAGTRVAGKELRFKLINLITSKPGYPIYIDWQQTEIIVSSFADEFLGKLFVEIGKEKFEATIKNINMKEVIEHIINKAITERSSTG